MSNHPIRYGGDYVQIKENLLELLTVFDECKIRPIFVFGGISVPRSSRGNAGMRNLQRRVRRLETVPPNDHSLDRSSTTESRGGLFRTPIFTKEVLVNVLNEMGVPHVTCNSETVKACAALAAYLRCPLIANGCELFLFDFEEPVGRLDRFLYIPLRYISTKPVPHPSTPNCMCLVAHIFSPSNCCVHRIPYMLRPFFAIFFKPPIGSYFPLPYRIFSNLRRGKDESTNFVRPMVQRARELISWLESAKSPLDVLEDSVRQLEDRKVIISFIKELVYLATFFKIDLKEGEELAKHVPPVTNTSAPYRSESADFFTSLDQKSCPEHLKQFIDLIETERSLMSCEATDLISKLPPCFLQLYRSTFNSTVIFSRLLSDEVFLSIMEENMSCDAASDCSTGLRFLQYCVGLDFLKHHAYQMENLERSTQPTISEISRSHDASHFTLSTIELRPLTLPNCDDLSEMCISFIHQHTGCRLKSVNNWIEILALTLTLWHKSKHPNANLDILEEPTALATALLGCAVVASGGKLTAQHLSQLAGEMSCGYNQNILHEIGELQLLCISLLSLIRLISAVGACESSRNLDIGTVKLPQGDQFFSSSQLIHNLAVALAESPDRKSLNVWINKILSPLENAEISQKATLNMIMLTRSLCEMRTVHPIEYVSRRETLPFPPSKHRPVSRDGNHCERSERPFHDRAVSVRRVSNMRGGRGGNFGNSNGGQRAFANKVIGNAVNGRGEFFKLGNQELRQFGPQKADFVESDGKRAFPNRGGPLPSTGNRCYDKRNKEQTFPPRSGFYHSDGVPENLKDISPVASESTNPFLVRNTSAVSGSKPGNPFLFSCVSNVDYASSEFGGSRAMNDRGEDTKKSTASEYGFKSGSAFKRQSMNTGPVFACNNTRNGNVNPEASSRANRQRILNVPPSGDASDPRNLDNRTEVGLRKNFENANSRQQRGYQHRPSFNNFGNRNSNVNANRGKPTNGVPRRGTFNGRFQRKPLDCPPSDIQSKWKASSLDDEIKRLASEFA
ncbi:hypothetical protein Aperf_G00000010432 [Anoplocephala perfoliata]